jgi:hypothetical protein
MQVQNRTKAALELQELQVKELEKVIHQLRATCEVYMYMIHQLETRIGDHSMPPAAMLATPSHKRHTKGTSGNQTRAYETSINVNSINEVEEQCFHYRLVQDVYTFGA